MKRGNAPPRADEPCCCLLLLRAACCCACLAESQPESRPSLGQQVVDEVHVRNVIETARARRLARLGRLDRRVDLALDLLLDRLNLGDLGEAVVEEQAAHVLDRVALLAQGRIGFEGTPDEFSASGHPVVGGFRDSAGALGTSLAAIRRGDAILSDDA